MAPERSQPGVWSVLGKHLGGMPLQGRRWGLELGQDMSSIAIAWELAENSNSRAPLPTFPSGHSRGVRPSSVLPSPPGGSDAPRIGDPRL